MTEEEFIEFRKKLKAHQAKMPEEEKQKNREHLALINAYQKRYPEGIPFQMPITFEELKEAMEQDRPFHAWEKYRGWYEEKIPHDWLL